MATTLTQSNPTTTSCSSFYLKDTTGTYHVTTNPGGYGTPNKDYTDISESYFELNYIKVAATIYTVTVNTTNFSLTPIQFANPALANSIAVGPTYFDLAAGTSIGDGVIQSKYFVFWANSGVLTVSGTVDTYELTFSVATDLAFLSQGSVIKIGEDVYTVSSILGAVVTTVEILTSTYTTQSYKYGFMNNTKFLIRCSADACIPAAALAIAQDSCCTDCVSEATCDPTSTVSIGLTKFALWLTAQGAFTQEDYLAAQDALDSLTNLCNCEDCGCS